MSRTLLRLPVSLLLLLAPFVAADAPAVGHAIPSNTPHTVSTAASFSFISGTARPTAHDHAPSGSGSPSGLDGSGMENYYFVFLALVFCAVGICVFLVLRRRRRIVARYRSGAVPPRESEGDGAIRTNWDAAARRHYWHGRWRNVDTSREEGLNEHGEAPPPYIPKTSSEERNGEGRGESAGPAVPLQTLSRDNAGLKPPDYSERSISPANHAEQSSNEARAVSPQTPRSPSGP